MVLWWVGRTARRSSATTRQCRGARRSAGFRAGTNATGGGRYQASAPLQLMRRGHRLFSDDVVIIERQRGSSRGPARAAADEHSVRRGRCVGRRHSYSRPSTDQQETSGSPSIHRRLGAGARRRRSSCSTVVRGSRLSAAPAHGPDATVLDLMPHVWGLPHARESAKEKFQAVSDIARGDRRSTNFRQVPLNVSR